MATIGDNPEISSRNGVVHLSRNSNREKGISIASARECVKIAPGYWWATMECTNPDMTCPQKYTIFLCLIFHFEVLYQLRAFGTYVAIEGSCMNIKLKTRIFIIFLTKFRVVFQELSGCHN
jgi:hypothetical protein